MISDNLALGRLMKSGFCNTYLHDRGQAEMADGGGFLSSINLTYTKEINNENDKH